ncbi:unnamed protein product [Schistocephalus solidus]|uniref:Uncharacterized protein n=1 Tax=Schistocephalus solidus TaxID=70667 RepID=A0A3P7CXS2_SCHSO|nr:unnamed protein product [Schistocephalus solidus]
MGIATGIRVGQALGAGDHQRPKATMTVAFLCMLVGITFAAIILLALGRQLCQIFRKDENVIEVALTIFPLLAVFIYLDAIMGVLTGVLRGSGMQKIGAIIILVAFYMVGAPIGFSLLLKTRLRLLGRSENANAERGTTYPREGLMFAAMLMDAYHDKHPGIRIAHRNDGHLLNRRRMQTPTRGSTTTVHDLLFADDCALNTLTEKDMQRSVDLFAAGSPMFD